MKKSLSILFIMTVITVLCCVFYSAQAADVVQSGTCGENLTWTLDAGGTLVVSGTGPMDNWYFSDGPWYFHSGIKTVVIEDGVTSIGDCAFVSCGSLTGITIPNSVTNICKYAFYRCTALTRVEIPDSVTSIGYQTFGDCDSLTIYGSAGSYAETYAEENDIPFEPVETHVIAAGDINADGTINNLDLLRLAKYFAGWDVTLG